MTGKYFVIDPTEGAILYTTDALSAAIGFVDAHEGRTIIASALRLADCKTWSYRVSIIDESSGKILAQGPEMDLLDAEDMMIGTTVALLPSRMPAFMGRGTN